MQKINGSYLTTSRGLHPGRWCKDVHNRRACDRVWRFGISSFWLDLLDNHIILIVREAFRLLGDGKSVPYTAKRLDQIGQAFLKSYYIRDVCGENCSNREGRIGGISDLKHAAAKHDCLDRGNAGIVVVRYRGDDQLSVSYLVVIR